MLIPLLATVLLFSCKQKTDFQFSDVASDTLTLVKDRLHEMNSDTTGGAFAIAGAVNSQKDIWLAMLTGCYEGGNFDKKLINNNLLYLGPSSNMYLGTIIDKRFVNNSFDVKTELKYLIQKSDFSKFATEGESVDNCDLTKIKDVQFSLDAVLSGVIAQGVNDSIGAKITSYDSLKAVSGKWQIDYIRESDFIKYLKTHQDNPDIKYYSDLVFNKKLRIITKVVKVTGFQADAYYKGGIDASVQAALASPVTVSVAKTDEEVQKDKEFAAKVTFSKKSSTEIHITTKNSFYIFGMIRQGKDL